jgi:manganese/zinc/iron transport system permease protein
VLVSVTTVANFEAVGSILVIAMLIVPAATAHLLTDRLGAMIAVGLLLATLSALAGHLLASFGPAWVGVPAATNTSAMMAVVAGGLLLLAVLAAPRCGLIGRLYHRLLLTAGIAREDILGFLHRWHELQGGGLIPEAQVLAGLGDTLWTRWGLRSLARARAIELETPAPRAGRSIRLTRAGLSRAAGVVRSHRLWESYVAKHFHLPLDHLHMSAERAEHFITADMRQEMSQELDGAGLDPHGKRIPEEA